MIRSVRSLRLGATLGGAAVVLALLPATAASAAAADVTTTCDLRLAPSVVKLATCVATAGAMQHLEALQRIADDNGGTRAAVTPGYDASVSYVADTLRAAGWKVALDDFTLLEEQEATLTQTAPVTTSYDTLPFTGTGYGEVSGTIVPVDLVLDAPRDPVTSGCEPEDFAQVDLTGPADIVLLQRGTCEFGIKAVNAQTAGAEAVVIMNQGNTPERSVSYSGTLIGANPDPLAIPVVPVSFDEGVALSQPGSTATVITRTPVEVPQQNVVAELPGRNADNVVMAGAHLDSVPAGPGINDDGSGSAALLEIAQAFSKVKPVNTLRFAFWGAEELGLVGSTAYVDGLSQAERDRIALYLNFDMVASPNSIYTVYDADQTGFEAPVAIPAGSTQVEDVFESYFSARKLPYDDSSFDGRSDYQAFIDAGIPSGGLFTGAEGIKTEEQAAIWGGTAGEAYDPCYHQACDTTTNIDIEAFGANIGAIAVAVGVFSYTTVSVNGVRGGYVPPRLRLPAPAGPEGTTDEGSGGLAPAQAELAVR